MTPLSKAPSGILDSLNITTMKLLANSSDQASCQVYAAQALLGVVTSTTGLVIPNGTLAESLSIVLKGVGSILPSASVDETFLVSGYSEELSEKKSELEPVQFKILTLYEAIFRSKTLEDLQLSPYDEVDTHRLIMFIVTSLRRRFSTAWIEKLPLVAEFPAIIEDLSSKYKEMVQVGSANLEKRKDVITKLFSDVTLIQQQTSKGFTSSLTLCLKLFLDKKVSKDEVVSSFFEMLGCHVLPSSVPLKLDNLCQEEMDLISKLSMIFLWNNASCSPQTALPRDGSVLCWSAHEISRVINGLDPKPAGMKRSTRPILLSHHLLRSKRSAEEAGVQTGQSSGSHQAASDTSQRGQAGGRAVGFSRGGRHGRYKKFWRFQSQ